jgi:hypothetical protein
MLKVESFIGVPANWTIAIPNRLFMTHLKDPSGGGRGYL